MSIGVLAHLFGRLPYQQLAEQVGQAGFSHVQLALWKAVESPDFSSPGKLSPGLARNIRDSFKEQGVSISVLACYLHLFDRDKHKRQRNIERFKELIRYAPVFDCHIVAAEVGKMPDGFTDEDWETLQGSLQELTETAERWGVFIGIEPANDHLIGDAETLDRMLNQLSSDKIGVVLDPGNLLNENNFNRQQEVIKHAFNLLGKRVIACHAKDRIIREGKIVTVPPGQGQLDYQLYFRLLNKWKPETDIIMEAANTPEERLASKTFLNKMLEKTKHST
ncbi:sugar phosphate isomerase/epimerase family protein [Sediminibacillus albus]|uniref:Sugar phosphate isomerase/epimerase n=1 Tax=Sediminibacillus albus TaxID=407036 RepID=A0A1G8WJ92_9BACI|nr:sugar phosphate isomerase/epimerase family protein [Sediminibacillus albus]SDJ77725.1 Sugar phosphate isomerase/epimerase [Sediminibacillus albus]